MSTFEQSEKKVLSFMEAVQAEKVIQEEEDAFRNTTDFKIKLLNQNMDKAREFCLDDVFARIYKDAVPLNDQYKNAYAEDLDAAFKDFMAARCPKGIEYYVKEGLRKNSPFAKRVLEAVGDLVDNQFKDVAFNIEDIDSKDLVFNSTDDLQKKLDIMGQDLEVPEIAQAVRDNVKNTAMSEITRAKREKENLKQIEEELKNDININSMESYQEALELRGVNQTRDYVPSLFNGIFINKMNKITPLYESGEMQEVYTYGTLEEFGRSSDSQYADVSELAFIEAVKEYTGLSILKALKLESFDKYTTNDLAQDYAQGNI